MPSNHHKMLNIISMPPSQHPQAHQSHPLNQNQTILSHQGRCFGPRSGAAPPQSPAQVQSHTFILRSRDLLSWHQARQVAVSRLSRDSSTSLAVRNISMFTKSCGRKQCAVREQRGRSRAAAHRCRQPPQGQTHIECGPGAAQSCLHSCSAFRLHLAGAARASGPNENLRAPGEQRPDPISPPSKEGLETGQPKPSFSVSLL